MMVHGGLNNHHTFLNNQMIIMFGIAIIEDNNEFLDLISTIQELNDPCYLGELRNCNNCGTCLK